MILYHGSRELIEKPDISFSRNNTDFGKGFYTTPIKLQAEKWAARFKRNSGYASLSIYEVDEINLRRNTLVLEFDSYSINWLEYVSKCRLGISDIDFDLVIGGVANDDVYNTLTLFFKGYIEKEEAIKQLRFEKPNIQYCFKNQKTIRDYLRYIGMEKL